ncbi:uncharacterized protein LOC135399066 isoform X4 [Ornithodoros turicata]|uniref:uncharacterized protein LOC135399066 isoform X4 n=1 Tax=Ornithodoros turicata TaxID=34597 RepID=UPI0031394871
MFHFFFFFRVSVLQRRMVGFFMVTPLFLLCNVPRSFEKKVPFSAGIHCDNNVTTPSSALLHDDKVSTCYTLPNCTKSLRITLSNPSNITGVKIVSEPAPKYVFYLPLYGDSFLASPNHVTANTWDDMQRPNATIHSVDIHGIAKACEVTIFDMEQGDLQHSTMPSGQNNILIICTTVPVFAVLVLVVIYVIYSRKRHKTTSRPRRGSSARWSLWKRRHLSSVGGNNTVAESVEPTHERVHFFKTFRSHSTNSTTEHQPETEQVKTDDSDNADVTPNVEMVNAPLLATPECAATDAMYDDVADKSTFPVYAVVNKRRKKSEGNAEDQPTDIM